jgi:PAS domain S-box-containing protein
MLKRLSIGTKILIAFVSIAILAVAVVGLVSYQLGSRTLEEESFNKLTAVREMKAGQISDYYQLIVDQIITLSEDRMVIDAMRAFDASVHTVETEIGITDADRYWMDAELRRYYADEYLERLIPNLLEEAAVSDYWPQDEDTRLMQSIYIAGNPHPTGFKHLLDNPGDGSSYSQAHELYHPVIRDFLERFGYYDIFLVDVDTGGHISYSVFKEVDYGTSLLEGPYSETNFAEAYRAARDADDPNFVELVDFDPYAPSYNAPAAFIASPIFDGDVKIGVLVFQMPIDRINNIMTSHQNWSDVGLGNSGETYLVGDDFLLRNQSRFLIEDSENYFNMIEEIGVPLETRAKIRNFDSTIGLQEVKTEGTQAALSGETGTDIFPDYRGVPVLSAYKPLDIPGMNWAIMSEIDREEAFAAIRALGIRTFGIVVILIVGIVVLAVVFSRTITRPLEELTAAADELATGNLDVEVRCTDQGDEVGVLACRFDSMRVSMKDLIENLEERVAERTAELERATERVRSIIENASDAIVTIDSDQNIVLFNPEAERTFGYTQEEVVGKPLTMLMVEESRAIHSREVDKFRDETALSRGMDVRRAISGQRKDGTSFPAEAGISKMVLDGEVFFTAFLRDVTQRKQMEERIRRSEERLKFALEGSNDGLWDWNIQTGEIYFSPRWQTMLGFEPGEIEARIGTWEQLVHPEDLSRVNQIMEAHLKGKTPSYEAEYRARSRSGEWLWILARGKVADYDENGKPVRFVGTHTDVTARKQAEEALRESEAKHRTIFQNSPLGMILFNNAGIIVDCNDRFVELMGSSREQLIGFNTLEKASDPAVREGLGRALSGTRAEFEGKYTSVTGDKTVYLRIIYNPVDPKQTPTQVIATLEDITERKKLEQEVSDQLSFIEALVDTIPNPMFVKDLETRFINFNEAYEHAFGIKRGDYIGKTVLDMTYLPPEDREAFQKEDSGLLQEGGEIEREVRIAYADGVKHDAIYQVKVIDLDGGRRAGIMGLLTDITDQKELERQLARANERMSIELNFAREIQIGMLPLIFPAFPQRKELDLYAILHSAREVGGDFYDFYFLDDDHLCFIIADVSGKGAPGALLMAVSKTLIKSRAADDHEPASILTHVNDELSRDNEAAMFVTAFLGILNVRTGELQYTNAGHNPPYIKRADGTVELVDAFHGPVIGALPGMTYGQDSTILDHRDMIMLYTDGVTEAMDEMEALYTDQRLAVLLQAGDFTSPGAIIDGTLSDVLAHQGEAEQADDITILAVQYTGQPEVVAHARLRLRIKNQLAELAVVEERFHEFALQNDVPDAVRQPISVVLDEMLNNIVSYAYDDEDEHEIDVHIELSGSRLVLTIKDDGVPFNPFGRGAPDTSLTVEDREIGGLGIHLVRSMMDEYLYQRHINKNVVTLVKMMDE